MPARVRDGHPPGTIGARLRASRVQQFVGREAELELFTQRLSDPEPTFAVLFVHGPPGVGKSALLRQFEALAEAADRRVTTLDMREVPLNPDGVRAALAAAAGDAPDVVLIDTYELAHPIDGWIREQLVASLPSDVVFVVAGRSEPSEGWIADPGWRSLTRVISLRNLDRDDAGSMLAGQPLDPRDRDRILDQTFGHPLALAVYVDVLCQPRADGGGVPNLLDSPDVVRSLLNRFVDEVPTARHRAALELCAHVRFTSQQLLRVGLDVDDEAAAELFDWLRSLSFVDTGRNGVFPHDLARDILDSDLRWRDAESYERLHRRVRAALVSRVRSTQGEQRTRATTDLVFLHRSNPLVRPFWDFSGIDQGFPDRLRPGDAAALRAMTEVHQGPESAAVLNHWLVRQPEAFVVFRRGSSPDPRGFTALLDLHRASAEDLAIDLAARAMWYHVQHEGGAPAGRSVIACRWVMDLESHHAPGSLGFGLTSVQHLQHMLSHGHRAFDFIGGISRPEELEPVFSYIDFRRLGALEHDLDGRRWHGYVMDWRRRDVDTWFAMLADRELGAPVEPSTQVSSGARTIALSQADFAAAVRAVLRDIDRPDRLRENPLLWSRLLRGQPGDPAEALAGLVREAVARLAEDERTVRYHRVLDRTYLRPAPTQERAAEILALPFSTYRRHLARGTEAVVAALWDRELYG